MKHGFKLCLQHFIYRFVLKENNLKYFDPIYFCRNPNFGLTTKVRGLQGWGPRGRPESHITWSWEGKECKKCEGMNPHTPKWTPIVGVEVPNGLLNLHSAIARVKTHWFGEFFILLESYWNLNV
jgi:hypothetical protein